MRLIFLSPSRVVIVLCLNTLSSIPSEIKLPCEAADGVLRVDAQLTSTLRADGSLSRCISSAIHHPHHSVASFSGAYSTTGCLVILV